MMNADIQLNLTNILDLTPAQKLDILKIRNQDGVRNNMYTNHTISESEHLAWIERLKENSQTKFFAVILDGKIVGGISLNSISQDNKRADWAFYLDEKMQGRGVGSALEASFLDYAFSDADLEKLNCEVLEFNTPVVKLHKKFGFSEEGFRRNHIIRDGKPVGIVMLGITKSEWADRKNATLLSGAWVASWDNQLDAFRVDPPAVARTGDYYMDLINEIEAIRGKNNKNWMDLLRLSFKHAPRDAASIISQIYAEDQRISQLAKELTR